MLRSFKEVDKKKKKDKEDAFGLHCKHSASSVYFTHALSHFDLLSTLGVIKGSIIHCILPVKKLKYKKLSDLPQSQCY